MRWLTLAQLCALASALIVEETEKRSLVPVIEESIRVENVGTLLVINSPRIVSRDGLVVFGTLHVISSPNIAKCKSCCAEYNFFTEFLNFGVVFIHHQSLENLLRAIFNGTTCFDNEGTLILASKHIQDSSVPAFIFESRAYLRNSGVIQVIGTSEAKQSLVVSRPFGHEKKPLFVNSGIIYLEHAKMTQDFAMFCLRVTPGCIALGNGAHYSVRPAVHSPAHQIFHFVSRGQYAVLKLEGEPGDEDVIIRVSNFARDSIVEIPPYLDQFVYNSELNAAIFTGPPINGSPLQTISVSFLLRPEHSFKFENNMFSLANGVIHSKPISCQGLGASMKMLHSLRNVRQTRQY